MHKLLHTLKQRFTFGNVPGTVIVHSSASSGLYIGSPSITTSSTGEIFVSHDYFGPRSEEFELPETDIYRSTDSGLTWEKRAVIKGAFWSKLFWLNNRLVLLGTNKHHGDLVIRESLDLGITWSNPTDETDGLLAKGTFHCAPTPFVEHAGRLWKAFEKKTEKQSDWPKFYNPFVLSIDVEADILNKNSWEFSNELEFDEKLLNGNFGGWLEGNIVLTPENKLTNILRVENDHTHTEHVALCNIDTHLNSLSLHEEKAFVQFPGGSKKFIIRKDKSSGKYLALTNTIKENQQTMHVQPDNLRNQLSLISSVDLLNWEVEKEILYHNDHLCHGFQYVSWIIKDEDILFVSRTAHDDKRGGAATFHDANFLTFHTIRNFRSLLK